MEMLTTTILRLISEIPGVRMHYIALSRKKPCLQKTHDNSCGFV